NQTQSGGRGETPQGLRARLAARRERLAGKQPTTSPTLPPAKANAPTPPRPSGTPPIITDRVDTPGTGMPPTRMPPTGMPPTGMPAAGAAPGGAAAVCTDPAGWDAAVAAGQRRPELAAVAARAARQEGIEAAGLGARLGAPLGARLFAVSAASVAAGADKGA